VSAMAETDNYLRRIGGGCSIPCPYVVYSWSGLYSMCNRPDVIAPNGTRPPCRRHYGSPIPPEIHRSLAATDGRQATLEGWA
jgi:hypothetical protein